MAEAKDTAAPAFKDGTITCLARIVGADGSAITQADVSAAEYSIYQLDENDVDSRTVVTGHDGVSLTVSAVIFNTLQTDALWTVDDTGYNFRHQIDISAAAAFAAAGVEYLIEYLLTPTSGQVIIVRFRVHVI